MTDRILLRAFANEDTVSIQTVSARMKSPQRFYITYNEFDQLQHDGRVITSDIHSFVQLRLDERHDRIEFRFTWLSGCGFGRVDGTEQTVMIRWSKFRAFLQACRLPDGPRTYKDISLDTSRNRPRLVFSGNCENLRAAHLGHPRFEHLVKTGSFLLASDLAYGRARNGLLDETQNRTHRILRIAAEDVPFLRKLDVGMETLQAFQGYAGLKDRQRLLRWQLENRVSRDIPQILAHMTTHKFLRYMNGQYVRRGNMQAVVSEYRDYLDMCVKLGYDKANSFVLYPKDLQQAHDRAVRRLKLKADAQLRRDFELGG